MTLRIAVVGAGRVGAVHAANVVSHPDAELLYVVDPDPERGRYAALGHHIWRPRLEHVPPEHIDAIIVASPTQFHLEHVSWALHHNLAVLCEKPAGADAEALAQLQRDFPRARVMVGFNRRFDPTFASLHQRLREGDIGHIQQVSIISRDPAPPPAEYRTTCGGMVRDMSIHDLDMALFLTDDITEVFAVGHREADDAILGGEYSYDERLDADFATIVLLRSDGATTTITNTRSCASGYDQRIEAHGPFGTLQAENIRPTAVRYSSAEGSSMSDPYVEFFTDRYAQAYERELDAFLAAVQGVGEWSPSLADAEAALRVADAAERSMLTGERVTVTLPERPHTDSLPMIAPPPRRVHQRGRPGVGVWAPAPATASLPELSEPVVVNERIAAAPITWGVCEAPGWGFQMDRDTVLRDMSDLGFTSIETGPSGWLGESAREVESLVDVKAMRTLVATFVPLVLHESSLNPLPDARTAMEELVGSSVRRMVLAAVYPDNTYDEVPVLSDADLLRVAHRCNMIADLGDKMGIEVVMHPHYGTVIHDLRGVETIIEHSGVDLCLDTGHLLLGGVDPVMVAEMYGDRVGHVHLKDVDLDLLERVQDHDLRYSEAVAGGLYVPLGKGGARIKDVIEALHDYRGYYVLEQDRVIDPSAIQDGTSGTSLSRIRAQIRQDMAGSAAFVQALVSSTADAHVAE